MIKTETQIFPFAFLRAAVLRQLRGKNGRARPVMKKFSCNFFMTKALQEIFAFHSFNDLVSSCNKTVAEAFRFRGNLFTERRRLHEISRAKLNAVEQ